MKPLDKPFDHEAPNAWGRDSKTTRQRYRITAEDVGKKLPHHRGNCDKRRHCMGRDCKNQKEILRKHIGSVVEVVVDRGCVPSFSSFGGYHSWDFVAEENVA